MTHIYAFVDSIGVAPTTLLNLDDEAPLSVVEGTKMAPPTRRASAYGSSARDGDVVAQESYNDRSITIPLAFKEGTTADQHATTVQALGRLLDGPQWLKWQNEGASAPVFFRTRYGDIDVDDEYMEATPRRYLTLTLVAEPFAYGLPETGVAAIANDPTAATNPMSYVFPSVKGDVVAPLQLSAVGQLGAGGTYDGVCLTVVCSMAAVSVPATPYWYDFASGTEAAMTGYTKSTVSDSTFIGGSKVRYVRTGSGDKIQSVAYPALTITRPGDYRMFIRLDASAAGGNECRVGYSMAGIDPAFPDIDDLTLSQVFSYSSPTWQDMGIVRLPLNAPRNAGVTPLVPVPTSAGSFAIALVTSAAGTVDLDGVLFVPVGLDDAADTRTALVNRYADGNALDLFLDGVNGAVFGADSASHLPVAAPMWGDFPRVTPGKQNLLTVLRAVQASGTHSSGYDAASKTKVMTFNWLYYPQYLYARPAAT